MVIEDSIHLHLILNLFQMDSRIMKINLNIFTKFINFL